MVIDGGRGVCLVAEVSTRNSIPLFMGPAGNTMGATDAVLNNKQMPHLRGELSWKMESKTETQLQIG